MALITCEHVCLGYDGQTVLRDVNFTVSRGDLLCVVGENGSGKSTLIKGLLGLKAPEQGSITLGDGLVRNEIGYLPQQTQLQRDFPASVAEVARSGCINQMHGRAFYSRADRARAQENMERMGIEAMVGSDNIFRHINKAVLRANALVPELTRARQERHRRHHHLQE